MDPAAGWLWHKAVVPRQGEVGDVDVEGRLEEHRALALQVWGTRPEPVNSEENQLNVSKDHATYHLGMAPVLAVEVR